MTCVHFWKIDTPNGATSGGTCKRCGAEKRFPNSCEESYVMDYRARKEAREAAKVVR